MSCIDLGFYTISPFKLMWEVGRHSVIYALHHPLYSLQESIYGRGLGRDRFDSWNASRFVMFYYALLARDSTPSRPSFLWNACHWLQAYFSISLTDALLKSEV